MELLETCSLLTQHCWGQRWMDVNLIRFADAEPGACSSTTLQSFSRQPPTRLTSYADWSTQSWPCASLSLHNLLVLGKLPSSLRNLRCCGAPSCGWDLKFRWGLIFCSDINDRRCRIYHKTKSPPSENPSFDVVPGISLIRFIRVFSPLSGDKHAVKQKSPMLVNVISSLWRTMHVNVIFSRSNQTEGIYIRFPPTNAAQRLITEVGDQRFHCCHANNVAVFHEKRGPTSKNRWKTCAEFFALNLLRCNYCVW